MNEIINVTSKGIAYNDEDGNQQCVEFNNCHQNFLAEAEERWGTEYTDERKKLYQTSKYVGVRYTHREPPAILLYTNPPIKFSFSTRAKVMEVLGKIKIAGWRTRDGE